MTDTQEPLHRKYRPATLDDVLGNDATINSLISVIRREEGRQHSLLFTGPSGCGKTTLARIVKTELGCNDGEFFEYNTANVRGIDTIRSIMNECRYAPLRGRIRVYLLDEVHKLTNDAQNALLKLLEDTPSHVYFLLCTTDPEKLIKTIRTRCATFPVTALNIPLLTKLVKDVTVKEKVTTPKEIIHKIALSAQGSPRQALVLLDQVIDISDPEQAMLALEHAVLGEATVMDLCRQILEQGRNRWPQISKLLTALESTAEPEQVRYAILGYLSKVLLNSKTGDDRVSQIMELFMESFMYSGKAGLIQACYLASKV